MTDDATGERLTVALEACPDPAVRFEVGPDGPLVTATNEPFRSRFDEDPTDSPLASVFADRLSDADSTDIAAQVARGEWIERPVTVEGATDGEGVETEYVLRAVYGADDRAGYIVFLAPSDPETEVCGMCDDVGPEQVASIVSHDLRNPLDVAKANLRAGRETGEDEYLETVAQAHDRMERIIQDVLTLAREDEVVDPSETVGLATLVTNAWETVDTRTATLTSPSSLPDVTVDPDRVERLLENLFRNAVDHAGPGTTVRVGRLEDDTVDGFYVADDGPGVPETDRERVFEPGYTSTAHGTGLGLAIVDRIATAHGWQVTLTDSDDGGARFEVQFDRAPDSQT